MIHPENSASGSEPWNCASELHKLCIACTEKLYQSYTDSVLDTVDRVRPMLEEQRAEGKLGTAAKLQSRQIDLQLEVGLNLLRQNVLIAVYAQTEAMAIMEAWVSNVNQAIMRQLDAATNDLPCNSQTAMNNLRNAVEASGTAYESMSKATRQVTNFASNNMTAAAVRAVKTAKQKISHSGQ